MGKGVPALTHRGFVTGRPSGSLQRELKARSPTGQGGCAAIRLSGVIAIREWRGFPRV